MPANSKPRQCSAFSATSRVKAEAIAVDKTCLAALILVYAKIKASSQSASASHVLSQTFNLFVKVYPSMFKQFASRTPLLLLAFSCAALAACTSPKTSQQQVQAANSASAPRTTALAPQVQQQALAPSLYELAYSGTHNALFVASSGGFGPNAQASQLFRLDPTTLAIQAQVTLPRRGFGLALDDAANRLYVGNGFDSSITVLDTRTLQTIGVIELAEKITDAQGQEKYAHHFRQLVLDPAHNRLYAPGLSVTESALYIVNTQDLAVEKVIPGFGPLTTGIALDQQNQRLFLSDLQGGLYEVSSRNLAINKTYQVPADQLLNLAFDANSGRLFATDQGLQKINERRQQADASFKPTPANRLIELNPNTGAIIQTAPAGEGPVALLFDAAGQRIFVTNRGSGSVTVHKANDLGIVQTIDLPDHPNSLAYIPGQQTLFVSVKSKQDRTLGVVESVARVVFP